MSARRGGIKYEVSVSRLIVLASEGSLFQFAKLILRAARAGRARQALLIGKFTLDGYPYRSDPPKLCIVPLRPGPEMGKRTRAKAFFVHIRLNYFADRPLSSLARRCYSPASLCAERGTRSGEFSRANASSHVHLMVVQGFGTLRTPTG